MVDSTEKWNISLYSGVVFLIIASPFLFEFVNNLLSPLGLVVANNGCPTILGLIIHAIVFVLVTRLSMEY
jgi:hypothetical protein